MSVYKFHTESSHFLLLLNVWGMSTIRQCDFAILAAIGLIQFQECTYLRLHGLWWENVGTGPSRDGSQLSKKAHVEERSIGDDLVIDAMYPENGWLDQAGDEIVLAQISGGERIVHAQITRSNIRPAWGGHNITR